MNNQNLTFIDFCSGIGAGRLGLEMLGLKCLAHSEINNNSDDTYKKFFADNNNLGDLTNLSYDKIPSSDILIAGFPCQTFSIVGKRTGFEDERGQIIYYLSDILKNKKIPYFIFENVKGLVNHNKGNTLKSIITLLNSSGYEVFYKVLNSIDYGVPQLRERIYFVGIRADLCNKTFEFPKKQKQVNLKEFLLPNNNMVFDIENSTFKKYLKNKYNYGKVNIEEILKREYCIIDTRQSDLRIYENKCPTLRTGRHGLLYVRKGNLYKLQGLEALLLQGFSKEYVLKAMNINNNLLLSQAGNAMTVNVISAIGRCLLRYIEDMGYEFSSKRFANC